MCHRQRSWKWQWVSNEPRCAVEPPAHGSLCRHLAGKRIILFGDSLTQQHFVSLASLAGEASTATAWKPPGCEQMRHLECLRVCGGREDSTPQPGLICQRTHFGLALDTRPIAAPHNCSHAIQPSVVAPVEERFRATCLRAFDLVVINQAAHWVGNDGALGLERCLRETGGMEQAAAARAAQRFVTRLYAQQMRRDAAHLQTLVHRAGRQSARSGGDSAIERPRIYYRTSVPASPTSDILAPDTPDGSPPIFLRPSRSVSWVEAMRRNTSTRFNHHLIPRLNALARAIYRDAGLRVMDVELPMSFRVDGHLDPLHYCLPGPPDFWAQLLPFMLDR